MSIVDKGRTRPYGVCHTCFIGPISHEDCFIAYEKDGGFLACVSCKGTGGAGYTELCKHCNGRGFVEALNPWGGFLDPDHEVWWSHMGWLGASLAMVAFASELERYRIHKRPNDYPVTVVPTTFGTEKP